MLMLPPPYRRRENAIVPTYNAIQSVLQSHGPALPGVRVPILMLKVLNTFLAGAADAWGQTFLIHSSPSRTTTIGH